MEYYKWQDRWQGGQVRLGNGLKKVRADSLKRSLSHKSKYEPV